MCILGASSSFHSLIDKAMIRTTIITKHLCKRSFSSLTHIAGHGWTGALGTGVETMTGSQTSSVSPSERDNSFQSLPSPPFDNVINAAAGWGHTVLVTENDQTDKIYVAGRLYDFQTLLRFHRMPAFVRRLAVKQSLLLERDEDPGVLANMMEKLFRNIKDKEEGEKYQRAIFPDFVEIKLPEGDVPLTTDVWHQKTLAASAGLTAVIGKSGQLYTLGINQRGQCGIGDRMVHHNWEPRAVILKTGESVEGIDGHALTDITNVELGLQHGIALDRDGNVFGWGKGARGQLGNSRFKSDDFDDGKESTIDFEFGAVPIDEFEVVTAESRSRLTGNDAKIRNISSGWNHSAAITDSNHVFVWGKNALAGIDDNNELKAVDAPAPTPIEGLPSDMEVKDVACGSHHTSILMEDGSVYALGITTDTAKPIDQKAVQIIPAGLIDTPIKQFSSHFDRTTIVAGDDGEQVLEVQLWSTEDLRNGAVFEPEWVETLTQDGAKIKMVQRGWLHTVVITEL
jgi:alpha-tubulin suppressor-like RCC1 family protein